MSDQISVSAALVFEKGRLLIARRRADSHFGGFWEFPGGKLERAESFENCLKRELKEELGIVIRVDSLIFSIGHFYQKTRERLHIQFYKCALISGKPKPIECQSFKWIAQNELDSFIFPPADARLIHQLKERHDLWKRSG